MTNKDISFAESGSVEELVDFGLSYNKEELLEKAKGIVTISYGSYKYGVFNVCFLHDILSSILNVLWMGYIPNIDLKDEGLEWNWSDYFYPTLSEFDVNRIEQLPIYECSRNFSPIWRPGYGSFRVGSQYELMCKLYKEWLVVNESVKAYIQKEYFDLFEGKGNVLGVLCRGTDLVAKQPKGHPKQPEMDELIAKVKYMKKELECSYIYVASEEKRLVNEIETAFPECVLENKRHYCDDVFYQRIKDGCYASVGTALYDPSGNDRYSKGLEYFSSLMLLSKCKGLVAGDCGGSECALYLNDHRYEQWYIFSKGFN